MKYILVVLSMLVFTGCASSKLSEKSVVDKSATDSLMQKVDALSFRFDASFRNSFEKFKDYFNEKIINKTTTNYSAPDSTGKQHMTSQEVYNEQNNTKKTEQQKDVTEISVQQLQEHISSLEIQVKELKDISTRSAADQKNIMDSLTDLLWVLLILIACAAIVYFIIKIRK